MFAIDIRRPLAVVLIALVMLAAGGLSMDLMVRRVRSGRRRREGEPESSEDSGPSVECITYPMPAINYATERSHRREG